MVQRPLCCDLIFVHQIETVMVEDKDNLADKATNNHKNLRIIEVSIAQSPSLW